MAGKHRIYFNKNSFESISTSFPTRVAYYFHTSPKTITQSLLRCAFLSFAPSYNSSLSQHITNILTTYYTEEGFLFRYLPQPAAVPRSPNSGLAVMTVVSWKQMSGDNHGYVIPENLVITWPYDRPSAPQVYQCKITQSTGRGTQMQLKVLFVRKSDGRTDF